MQIFLVYERKNFQLLLTGKGDIMEEEWKCCGPYGGKMLDKEVVMVVVL